MITIIQINLLTSLAKSLRIASINAQSVTSIGSSNAEIRINSSCPRPNNDRRAMS